MSGHLLGKKEAAMGGGPQRILGTASFKKSALESWEGGLEVNLSSKKSSPKEKVMQKGAPRSRRNMEAVGR